MTSSAKDTLYSLVVAVPGGVAADIDLAAAGRGGASLGSCVTAASRCGSSWIDCSDGIGGERLDRQRGADHALHGMEALERERTACHCGLVHRAAAPGNFGDVLLRVVRKGSVPIEKLRLPANDFDRTSVGRSFVRRFLFWRGIRTEILLHALHRNATSVLDISDLRRLRVHSRSLRRASGNRLDNAGLHAGLAGVQSLIKHAELRAGLTIVIFWSVLGSYETSWVMMIGPAITTLGVLGAAAILLDRFLWLSKAKRNDAPHSLRELGFRR